MRACYDEGKRYAETLFFDYRRQHKLGIKIMRIFNTYGSRMHPNDGRLVQTSSHRLSSASRLRSTGRVFRPARSVTSTT